MLLYCIVLYCIVLYCIVLYCIVLYCIVLYSCLCLPEQTDNEYVFIRECVACKEPWLIDYCVFMTAHSASLSCTEGHVTILLSSLRDKHVTLIF